MKELSLKVGTLDINAVVSEVGDNAMVAMRPFIDRLGMDRSTQQRKIMKNPQFSWRLMPLTAADGKRYEMLCIPVKQLGMWLCTINANKVKPEIREKLIQFQMHLQVVIHEALVGRVSPEIVAELRKTIELMSQQMSFMQKRIEALESNADVQVSNSARSMANKRWNMGIS